MARDALRPAPPRPSRSGRGRPPSLGRGAGAKERTRRSLGLSLELTPLKGTTQPIPIMRTWTLSPIARLYINCLGYGCKTLMYELPAVCREKLLPLAESACDVQPTAHFQCPCWPTGSVALSSSLCSFTRQEPESQGEWRAGVDRETAP